MKPNCGKKEFREIIGEKKGELREILELDQDFLNSLLKYRVMSREHVHDIAQTPYDRNDKLLDFFQYHYTGNYNKVMDSLTENGQQHVVNYIYAAGGT